ncbi:MAG: GH36 C-terminal domain-containing protein [Bacteroidota bacterium]
MRGLDPDAMYQVDEHDEIRSGRAWMNVGIDLYLSDYQSNVLRVRQVE